MTDTVDLSLIGQVAIELMDDLDEYGSDAEVADVLVVIEVETEGATSTHWCYSGRPSTAVGLAHLALRGIEAEQTVEDEEGE